MFRKVRFSKKDFLLTGLFLVLLTLVVWAGVYLTFFLEERAFSEKVQSEQNALNLLADFFRDELNEAKDIVEILSTSPSLVEGLSGVEEGHSLEQINKVLDRYVKAVTGGVAYVMNKDGVTVASSNRHQPLSFVGKSYKFRPYFLEAIKGKPSQYFALGVTSKEKGFYASAPVMDGSGQIRGVVVIKKDLSNLGLLFQEKPNTFFVNQDGVVFLAGEPELSFRTLFPLSPERITSLEVSRQFGENIGLPLMSGSIEEKNVINYRGEKRVYLHQSIGFGDWQVVGLISLKQVQFYRWVGVMLTGFVAGLLTLFFIIYFIQSRSRAVIEQQKERMEAIFSLTPSAIFTVDPEMKITSWNKKAEEITGYSAEEIVGQKCLIFSESPCRDQDQCQVLSGSLKEPVTGRECTILTKDGQRKWITKNIDVLRDNEGKVVGGIESFEDVTERRAMEEALRESQDRYNLAMEVISEGVWDYYPQEERLFLSSAWFKMLGYQEGELQQGYTTWLTVLHPDDVLKAQKDFREFVLSGRDDYEAEFRMRERSGAWRWVFAKGRVIARGKQGEPLRIVGTHTDITKRKEAEALKERAMNMRSKFVSTVSHELRTPLGPIKEGISIVLDGLVGAVNPEQRGLLEAARRNAERLHRLINDVLDYQKLDSGGFQFRFQPEDINAIVEEVCKDMRLLTEEKGLSLDIHLDMNLTKVRCDKDRIIQVLANLLGNAVKFTDAGGVTVYTRQGQGCAEIVIADTGWGIQESDVPKLFESFTQVEGRRGRITGSSGLGLAICREIIQRHGGKIWVESEYGKGSEFHFVLPV